MKTNNTFQINNETLAKFLSGELSETESESFEKEVADSEVNKLKLDKMKKQWSAMQGYKEQEMPDTRKAWDKLHARLHAENLIPGQEPEVKFRLVPALIKIAAFVLVLLGIGAVVYFTTNHKPVTEMVQVDTGNEANTLIKTLTDGTVIYIAQNSQFSFPTHFESESRNVQLKGEAFFDIASNPDIPFIIETDEALIQVLGTAFNVKTQNGTGFELFVDRGKVKVSLKNDPSHSQVVVAGEKIAEFKNNLVKSKYVNKNTNLWYRQRMHFKDESLQNIINVLNRNFNTTFVVAEKETGNRKLTVTFYNETAETMTELICLTLNLKSQNINGSVVLSENKNGATRN
jgi:ferric-dicitrate binding protein FerR (iron transport regulator)